MTITTTAPWHKASFMQFVQDRLPQLLAARLPLVDYQVTETNLYTCAIRLALASPAGDCVVDYAPILQPDDEGVFIVDGAPRVVVATAATAALDTAEIQRVGEQLYTYIAALLGEAPEGLPWDEALARAWLPLDRWIHTFLTTPGSHNPSTRVTGSPAVNTCTASISLSVSKSLPPHSSVGCVRFRNPKDRASDTSAALP